MSKRAWIIFIVIAVVLLGGLVALSGSSKINVSNVNPNIIQKAAAQSGNIADHVYGNADSKALLVEYGDYQCPYCGNEHPIIKQVTSQYQGQLAFVFRNFPLTTLHPNALAAAGAVEAAGLQGKYWEMHNLLYESQSTWENLTGNDRTNLFVGDAKQLGLNTTQFTTDLGSAGVSKKISFDLAVGQKLGVDSTPTFYLDGKVVDQGVWSNATKLTAAINAVLTKYNITPPTAATTTTTTN